MEVFALVVTSGVIPVPAEWMSLPRVRVAISVDGLPEHHDIRRKPATYERILKNIEGCEVNIHWVITRPMLRARGLPRGIREVLERARRSESHLGERLHSSNRREKPRNSDSRGPRDAGPGIAPAWRSGIRSFSSMMGLQRRFFIRRRIRTSACFAKMSANYSADFETRVEPCVFGGDAGLLPVRMRRQQRLALGPGDQGGGPREGRSFYRQLSEDRPHDEPPSSARGSADAMEHFASIHDPKNDKLIQIQP